MSISQSSDHPSSFSDASGKIGVTLMNDMMFHCVMSRSNASLKALVCSLKGFPQNAVLDVFLANPVDYSVFHKKEIILDVVVRLSTGELMDIELQVYRDRNWVKRSLLYLGRTYDSIDPGESYALLKPTTHVCITDRNLFPDHPEFYGQFLFYNPKKQFSYSSQLAIHVLELGLTELATKEDIANGLVFWAELFKATTWEEVRRIVTAFPVVKEVAEIMYAVNVQPQELTIMQAHERYMSVLHAQQAEIKEQDALLKEQGTQLKEQGVRLKEQDTQLEEQKFTIATQQETLAKYKALYGDLPADSQDSPS